MVGSLEDFLILIELKWQIGLAWNVFCFLTSLRYSLSFCSQISLCRFCFWEIISEILRSNSFCFFDLISVSSFKISGFVKDWTECLGMKGWKIVSEIGWLLNCLAEIISWFSFSIFSLNFVWYSLDLSSPGNLKGCGFVNGCDLIKGIP